MNRELDKSFGSWDEETSVDVLAERQGAGPFRVGAWFARAPVWPAEDSIEEFEAWLQRSRQDGRGSRAASDK